MEEARRRGSRGASITGRAHASDHLSMRCFEASECEPPKVGRGPVSSHPHCPTSPSQSCSELLPLRRLVPSHIVGHAHTHTHSLSLSSLTRYLPDLFSRALSLSFSLHYLLLSSPFLSAHQPAEIFFVSSVPYHLCVLVQS